MVDAHFQAPASALTLSATYTSVLPHILQVSRSPMPDSLQFSLTGGLHISLPCLRGSFRRQRDWENVFVHMYTCVCVYMHNYVYRRKEKHISNSIF